MTNPTTPAGEKKHRHKRQYYTNKKGTRSCRCLTCGREIVKKKYLRPNEMQSTPTPDQKWEERFDEIWKNPISSMWAERFTNKIKSFITSLLAEARAEGEANFVRQMIHYGFGVEIERFEAQRAQNEVAYEQIAHLQASDKGK